MELLFVFVIAASFGAILRYTLPQRDTYGALLLPAVTGAVGIVVWVALLWALRLTFDGTWIWVASLGAALVAGIVTALVLPRRRIENDAAKLDQLAGARPAR